MPKSHTCEEAPSVRIMKYMTLWDKRRVGRGINKKHKIPVEMLPYCCINCRCAGTHICGYACWRAAYLHCVDLKRAFDK